MANDERNLPSLNDNDEMARRLCALAIAFSNARKPLRTSEVRATYYPDLNDQNFRKKFLRDRERLAEGGLVVKKAGTEEDEALWQADGSSFADSGSISAEDALMLDVLCASLVEDPSFAYRSELRLALAKVDRAFGALSAVRLSPEAQRMDSPVATLVSCMSDGVLARIAYVDAKGTKSERVVAPFDSFGLRDRTYFVCALAQDDELGEDAPMRTLRADRIARARATSTHFERPADFAVSDYIRLPFQIGPTVGTARFVATPQAERDAVAELDRRGTSAAEGDGRAWDVPMSSEDVAAAWAIASGVVPTAPQSLVATYGRILEQALGTTYEQDLAPQKPLRAARKAGRRGRPGAAEEMRELLALVGSLTSEGDILTIEGVASRFGITRERAELLLDLVLTACNGSSYQLPLGLADDDALVLCRSHGVTGKPIRLTRTETAAVVAALDKLEFPADDPLRLDLLASFATPDLTEHVARQKVATLITSERSEALEACSRALVSGACLSFAYQGADQSAPARRTALPTEVRHENNAWYLDTIDLDRKAGRTFRVDRMSDIRVMANPSESLDDVSSERENRMVTVAFPDAGILEALEWHGIQVIGTSGSHTVATIPFYGGTWLPRHLAACGGVATNDAELTEAVRATAQSLLNNR